MRLSKDITTDELMQIDYHYNFSDEELTKDWGKLCNTVEFKTGAQFKPGMKLCQHFFPNFFSIKSADGKSFESAWKDYDTMDKVREWGLTGMSQLWLSWIRRAVYMTAGLPNSSFYRPHFSRQVAMMTGKASGHIFDPCAGWGGRMLGAISFGWKYTACEPNKETYDNLMRLVDFLDAHDRVTIHNCPAEEYAHTKKYDVVITSPPYYNLEVYEESTKQSYNKFPTYAEWRDSWLEPLIETCLTQLVGLSAWNVMNFKRNDIVQDVISIHEKNGYELIDTIGFSSPLSNIRKLKNKDVTYIFKEKTL